MIRAFAVTLLSVLVLPSAALAENATVSIGGSPGQLTYAGSSVRDALFMTRGNPPALIFDRTGDGALLTPGNGCSDVFGNGTRLLCTAVGGATINLNAGDDFFSGGSEGVGMTVNGGAGKDQMIPAGNAQRTLNGEGDDDTFNLAGSPNRDVVDGGAGNDTLQYPKGPDELNGGAGTDTLEFSASASVTVSLDDQANDGASTDFASNAHSDIENVSGGDEEDAFTGSAAANVLSGGKGKDSLAGGAGRDTLLGGEGDDQIEAKDGEADTIDCGLGNDRATVDPIDTTSGCETLVLPDDDHDGVSPPQDCDDHNANIRPGIADAAGDGIDQNCDGADTPVEVVRDPVGDPPVLVVERGNDAPDFDRDGVLAGADCRDTDPAIRPGATDTPGDRIDQDCSGADAPYPRLTAKLTYAYSGAGRNTLLSAIELRELKDATVEARCNGCFARKRYPHVTGTLKLTKLVKGRKLRPGTKLTITVSRSGFVSEVRELSIRAKRKPTLKQLCLPPGAAKAGAC